MKMTRLFTHHMLLLLAFLEICRIAVNGVENPEELVNMLAGSFTDGDRFSTGNTLPLVGRPWGFNHWAPMTKDGGRNSGSWWFKGSEHMLTWLRCTHQPSPWIGDWGYFLFTPQIGNIERSPHHFWEPRGAVLKPYLFDAYVAPYGMRIELTPTDHAAMLRVTFPESAEYGDKHICFSEAEWDSAGAHDGGQYIQGRALQVHSERMATVKFAMHIRAESKESTSYANFNDMKCFTYPQTATVVHVRMATSLISADQASVNLNRELKKGKTFDEALLEAKMVWHKLMKRVDVVDAGEVSDASNKHLSIFYTGLWRGLTFPRRLDEVTSSGKVVHYSPYDTRGEVHDGYLVTDNGFWDTFRTVYPMLSLLYPDHLGTIIAGWLNAYQEGGWLPSWASPGYRNCMVGTFADVVIADAIVKGVKGFDYDLARRAILKDAFEEAPRFAGGAVGKEGLNEYVNRGYLPSDMGGEVVSRTVDYGFADYSTAKALLVLADLADKAGEGGGAEMRTQAKTLFGRATRAYTSLYDRGRGLMVPKNGRGEFSGSFNAIEWGNGYTEGNSWHHSFPPYGIIPDVDPNSNLRGGDKQPGGLVTLHGGADAMLGRLRKMLRIPSNFRVGSYGQEIHEMTEARAVAMGQYGHNNQPSHHILYLFAVLGDRRTTEETVRRVMERAYGLDFFAGDEDNGEMGSWYVLSALGLYSIVPGTPDYVLGSPLFRHVRIDRSDKIPYETYYDKGYSPESDAVSADHKHLDIIALGTSEKNIHVQSVTVGDTPVTGVMVSDALLQGDGVLQFVMEGEEAAPGLAKALHAQVLHGSHDKKTQRAGADKSEQEIKSLESDLKKKEHQIQQLSSQLKSANAKLLANSNSGSSGSEPFSSTYIFGIMVVVIAFALCISRGLESAGLLPSSGSGQDQNVNYAQVKSYSLNDFNSPMKADYSQIRQPPSGGGGRSLVSSVMLYSCGLCRAFSLWLTSDSISSGVSTGVAVAGAAGSATPGSRPILRWTKAESHTV